MDHTEKFSWGDESKVSYKNIDGTLEVYVEVSENIYDSDVENFLSCYGENFSKKEFPHFFNIFGMDNKTMNYILDCWGIPLDEPFEKMRVYEKFDPSTGRNPVTLIALILKKNLVPYIVHIYNY